MQYAADLAKEESGQGGESILQLAWWENVFMEFVIWTDLPVRKCSTRVHLVQLVAVWRPQSRLDFWSLQLKAVQATRPWGPFPDPELTLPLRGGGFRKITSTATELQNLTRVQCCASILVNTHFWFFRRIVNDSLRTDVPLMYPPYLIALCEYNRTWLFSSKKNMKFEVSKGQ